MATTKKETEVIETEVKETPVVKVKATAKKAVDNAKKHPKLVKALKGVGLVAAGFATKCVIDGVKSRKAKNVTEEVGLPEGYDEMTLEVVNSEVIE